MMIFHKHNPLIFFSTGGHALMKLIPSPVGPAQMYSSTNKKNSKPSTPSCSHGSCISKIGICIFRVQRTTRICNSPTTKNTPALERHSPLSSVPKRALSSLSLSLSICSAPTSPSLAGAGNEGLASPRLKCPFGRVPQVKELAREG